MGRWTKFFYVIGIFLLGFWMFKTIQLIPLESSGSFQAIQEVTQKTNVWAFAGLVCIFLPGIVVWAINGMRVDSLKLKAGLLETLLPSYSRVVPIWAQSLRIIGLGIFIYFTSKSITVIDGELELSFDYYWIALLGGMLFFCLPFMFPKNDKLL